MTWTCSTEGERYDQVRSDPPCTSWVFSVEAGERVGTTPPAKAAVLTGESTCICIMGSKARGDGATAGVNNWSAGLAAWSDSIMLPTRTNVWRASQTRGGGSKSYESLAHVRRREKIILKLHNNNNNN